MKNRILWLALGFLTAVALVMTSCGGGKTTTTVVPQTGTTTTEAPTVATTAPTSSTTLAKEKPQYGGTLTVSTYRASNEPFSWDPADFIWMGNYTTSPYLETLLTGDPQKGKRGTNEWPFQDKAYFPPSVVTGKLAESWELAPDKLSVTFHIRKGIMWNGKIGVMAARELTADDVAFSWKRTLASPKNVGTTWPFMDSVTATDKYTVVFKFKNAYLDWQGIGHGYYTEIVPPELAKLGVSDWKNAVGIGTGPFMLSDYVTGSSLTYTRNPNYWGKTTIDGKEYQLPFVQTLQWPIIVDPVTNLAALRTGKIDIAERMDWKYVDSLKATNPELQVWEAPVSLQNMIAMRCDQPPFSDVRVRRAVNIAVDKQGMVKSLFGGHAVVLSEPTMYNWTDVFTPMDELPESAKELFVYDTGKAKDLLAQAGYASGFKTELEAYTGTEDQVALIVDNLKKVGVDVTIKMREYAASLSILNAKSYSGMIFEGAGTRNPYDACRLIAYKGSPYNASGWDDTYYNTTADKLALVTDANEFLPAAKKLAVYVLDQAPFIWLPMNFMYRYAHPWVKNYYGEFDFVCDSMATVHMYVWIDQNLKLKMTGQQ